MEEMGEEMHKLKRKNLDLDKKCKKFKMDLDIEKAKNASKSLTSRPVSAFARSSSWAPRRAKFVGGGFNLSKSFDSDQKI